jgi:hypothetical protein
MDWKGLFDWSIKHNDGTRPSEFKVLSKEDRDFLEKALASFTYDEAKEMKEIINELVNHQERSEDTLVGLIEKLSVLIDIH